LGDKGAQPCGCCDVCLAAKRDSKSRAVPDMVLELLKEGDYTLRQIVERIPAPSDSVVNAIYSLADRSEIVVGSGSTFSISPDRGSKK
ncbi:MAG: hypothetical protein IJO17_01230, partial [Alistipes sp.]|nr:hypothetical protein [Alistipes sp.]